MSGEVTERVALVTGASSGIGAAAAEMLAQEGYYVFAAARRMDKLELLKSDRIEPMAMDVTNNASIHAAVDHIHSTKGRIDVLMNNAGYGEYGFIEGLSPEDARRQFDVNVFGALEVIKAVLPLMRSQQSGRILQMGSIVSHLSLPAIGWYAASKHAIKALMDALRLEVRQFGIRVVMIEPGPIATGFEEIAFASLDKAIAPTEYQPLLDRFTKMMRRQFHGCPEPDLVIKVIRKAVHAKNPKAAYTDRFKTHMVKLAVHLLPDWLVDLGIAERLK
ncbi:MAG: SDR family NAD(P)-dependent oxidoreductase [Pirellulales bacterium]|nr:SDR family NAD(P)-dependent oxidoreductase [Pirellulales bacterium]